MSIFMELNQLINFKLIILALRRKDVYPRQ